MRGLLYIVFLLIITGCSFSNSESAKTLDEAQRLMASDPAAALSALNGLDVSEFSDSATMAQWALLYSEALVANRISTPTDTIVDIAIDYYGSRHIDDKFRHASSLKALLKASGNNDALASALYLQKEKEFMLYKERIEHERFFFIGLTIILAACGVIIWQRQRLALNAAQHESLIAEASALKSQIDADRGDIGRLESKLHGMLDDRFTLIDSLCQTYYESQGTKTERKAIVDKVKNEIDSVRSDSFSVMERTVNDCRENILVKAKEIYADIKPDDYQLLVFIASGLSPRTISLLFGESIDVVYKRKSRLKSRLKSRAESSAHPEIMTIF